MNPVAKRLEEAFDAIAVCHCGEYCKDHGWHNNHGACWNPCPDSLLLNDAIKEILRLELKIDLKEESKQ